MGGSGGHEELKDGDEEGDDPEEGEEVVVPELLGVGVPLNAGEGSVLVLGDLATAVDVDDGGDPVDEVAAHDQDHDDRKQEDQGMREHELGRLFDHRECQGDVVEEAADGQQKDPGYYPEDDGQDLVVQLVALVQGVVPLVEEEVAQKHKQHQEHQQGQPHQQLGTAPDEEHVHDRQHQGQSCGDQQHLPSRVKVRQVLADLFGPRVLEELFPGVLTRRETVTLEVYEGLKAD